MFPKVIYNTSDESTLNLTKNIQWHDLICFIKKNEIYRLLMKYEGYLPNLIYNGFINSCKVVSFF